MMIENEERGLGACVWCRKTSVVTYGSINHPLCEEHWMVVVERIGGQVSEYVKYCAELGIEVKLEP